MRRLLRFVASVAFWLGWIVNAVLSVWCLGACWYQSWIGSTVGRVALMALFAVVAGVLIVRSVRRRRLLFTAALLSLGITCTWMALYRPVWEDDCEPPCARMPRVRFAPDGHTVTIDGVRDFHYRSAEDYDIRYRTETYDLDDLASVDFSITYWNDNHLIGHVMLSFGFKDGRYLAVSPEARLRRGRAYGIIPGLYRQYELMFVLATEEDVFQLRTNHRQYEHEEVYLYPTVTRPAYGRVVLGDLLRRAEAMATEPEYYNCLTYNCMTSIGPSAEKLSFVFFSGGQGPLNGNSDRLAWRWRWLRRTVRGESFTEYRKRHFINPYVERLQNPPNYSKLIRPD